MDVPVLRVMAPVMPPACAVVPASLVPPSAVEMKIIPLDPLVALPDVTLILPPVAAALEAPADCPAVTSTLPPVLAAALPTVSLMSPALDEPVPDTK